MRYSDGAKIRLYVAIGAAIKEQRKVHGLSRDQLAEAVGVSSSSIEKYETGVCAVPVWALDRIADVFDVKLDDLVPVLVDVAQQ